MHLIKYYLLIDEIWQVMLSGIFFFLFGPLAE